MSEKNGYKELGPSKYEITINGEKRQLFFSMRLSNLMMETIISKISDPKGDFNTADFAQIVSGKVKSINYFSVFKVLNSLLGELSAKVLSEYDEDGNVIKEIKVNDIINHLPSSEYYPLQKIIVHEVMEILKNGEGLARDLVQLTNQLQEKPELENLKTTG